DADQVGRVIAVGVGLAAVSNALLAGRQTDEERQGEEPSHGALYNTSPGAAEADLGRARLGARAVAGGGALEDQRLAERAATHHPAGASLRAARVDRAAWRGLVAVEVGGPLGDVARQVEHPVGRGAAGEGPD